MSGPSRDEIVQELLSRGVPASELAAIDPALARQAGAGLYAPRLKAPDKIAERGAYIRDYGQINKDRDGLAKVYPMTSELDRFHALNLKAGTGGWDNNLPFIKDMKEWADPHISEMSGIASGLQGKARPVGSGATSDFEQRLYRMGVPSPEKKGPTNTNIIAHMKGVMAEEGDRLAFQEEFLRRNGSLSGSQEAWARYVTSNPYTVQGEGGRTRLNAKRASWRQHFGIEDAPQRPPSGGKPAGWTSSLPKAQRNAAMMFKGAQGGMGTKANPYVPATGGEFDRLPAGAVYIDVDGRIKTKRN